MILAIGCMIVGFVIKMALFPFHGWQPAAHSYAHEGADPMIAGIMIKIPAYAMIRFFYGIFKGQGEALEYFLLILSVLAVCGVLYGSLKALRYDVYNKLSRIRASVRSVISPWVSHSAITTVWSVRCCISSATRL